MVLITHGRENTLRTGVKIRYERAWKYATSGREIRYRRAWKYATGGCVKILRAGEWKYYGRGRKNTLRVSVKRTPLYVKNPRYFTKIKRFLLTISGHGNFTLIRTKEINNPMKKVGLTKEEKTGLFWKNKKWTENGTFFGIYANGARNTKTNTSPRDPKLQFWNKLGCGGRKTRRKIYKFFSLPNGNERPTTGSYSDNGKMMAADNRIAARPGADFATDYHYRTAHQR